MPRISIQMTTDPSDPIARRAPSLAPLELAVPVEQVQDLWNFIACLATKTDVLIPAVMAIMACAQGSAPPPRKPMKFQ